MGKGGVAARDFGPACAVCSRRARHALLHRRGAHSAQADERRPLLTSATMLASAQPRPPAVTDLGVRRIFVMPPRARTHPSPNHHPVSTRENTNDAAGT